MFERFTDRARRSLVLAGDAAQAMLADGIGPEHLLVGLYDEGEGVAFQVLRSLGFKDRDLFDHLVKVRGPAVTQRDALWSRPYTDRAKKVLELSLREALQLGHNYIGTEHMLLGIVREGESTAAELLIEKAGDLATVRKTVIDLLAGYTRPASAAKVTVEIDRMLARDFQAYANRAERNHGPFADHHPLIAMAKAVAVGEQKAE